MDEEYAMSPWRRIPVAHIEDLSDAILGAGLEAFQMSHAPITGGLVFAITDDVVAPEKLGPGKHEIVVTLVPEMDKPGGPAKIALSVDGKVMAAGRLKEQIPQRCGTECMDVGMDCISPMCGDYEDRGLFPFTGTIERVTFDFENVKEPTGMERLKMATAMD
jgi:hypothetical protein